MTCNAQLVTNAKTAASYEIVSFALLSQYGSLCMI